MKCTHPRLGVGKRGLKCEKSPCDQQTLSLSTPPYLSPPKPPNHPHMEERAQHQSHLMMKISNAKEVRGVEKRIQKAQSKLKI